MRGRRSRFRSACALLLLPVLLGSSPLRAQPDAVAWAREARRTTGARVRSLQVTVLSTMLADDGTGEWGFAALVEADGHRLLFDTGARPDTVLNNARELGVDLSTVEDVVLSHNHDDHSGGLLRLRRVMAGARASALSRVHVAPGIFWSRPSARGEGNTMVALRGAYLETGGTFVEHAGPTELFPGVWLSGPVPRRYPEHHYGTTGRMLSAAGLGPDTIPEDQALVIDSDGGLMVLTGCGHAGLINIVTRAQEAVRRAPVRAVLGGFHLYAAGDEELRWTGERLREAGVRYVLGAHCTGLEAVYRLRDLLGLARESCVVGAVGSRFRSGSSAAGPEARIDPRRVAR